MKVVLLEDIKGSGKKNDIVEVSDGYARNYLFPKKLAVEATKAKITEVKAKKNSEDHRKSLELEAAKEIAKEIAGKKIVLKAKAGAEGKLFGSVTAKEIASEIKSAFGIEIDRRKISLDSDIKQFGSYDVQIKIYSGVTTGITVVVEE